MHTLVIDQTVRSGASFIWTDVASVSNITYDTYRIPFDPLRHIKDVPIMKFSRLAPSVASLAAGALLLSGCSTEGQPADAVPVEEQLTALNVGVTPIANAAHVYVALEEGYFEDEGLEVTPTIIQTASTAIPSLLNEELQFALMSSVPVITAASKRLPISIASGSDRYPEDIAQDTTALVAAPGSGVTDLKDLANKTVALVGLKSSPELSLRVILEDAGVDPDDVELVEIAYPDMVSALESNRVDAAFIVDPFLSSAEAKGFEVVAHPFTEGLGGTTALQWIASNEFVESNPDTATKFTAAMERAGEFATEHPEAVRDVLPEFTALSAEAIEDSVMPVYDADVTTEDLQVYVDLMTSHGFIEDGFDPSGLLWSTDGN